MWGDGKPENCSCFVGWWRRNCELMVWSGGLGIRTPNSGEAERQPKNRWPSQATATQQMVCGMVAGQWVKFSTCSFHVWRGFPLTNYPPILTLNPAFGGNCPFENLNGPNQDPPKVRFHVDWWEGIPKMAPVAFSGA